MKFEDPTFKECRALKRVMMKRSFWISISANRKMSARNPEDPIVSDVQNCELHQCLKMGGAWFENAIVPTCSFLALLKPFLVQIKRKHNKSTLSTGDRK
jgi:hypothetical protein